MQVLLDFEVLKLIASRQYEDVVLLAKPPVLIDGIGEVTTLVEFHQGGDDAPGYIDETVEEAESRGFYNDPVCWCGGPGAADEDEDDEYVDERCSGACDCE